MQGKKNNGKQIFILIICVIAFVITFIIQGKNGRDGNTSLNGVIAQIQVIISTIMVVASMKKGFITGIISNACLSGFVLFQVIKKFIDSNQAKIDSDEAKSLADAAMSSGSMEQYSGLIGKANGLMEKSESLHDAAWAQIPGIVVPLCTIITIAIIYVFASRTRKMHEELTESYEQLIETNRVIQEKDEKLTYLAYYDVLTSMPNRQLFIDKLEANIANSNPCTIIYSDIDDFKKINDIYGHNVGDAILCAYAERLKTFCTDPNFVARIGGDEFGIILNGSLPEASIINYIEKIRNLISEPVNVNGALFRTTMSYGIASYPQDGRNSVEIFRCTDIAVFNAKANGKDRPCFFSQNSQYIRK